MHIPDGFISHDINLAAAAISIGVGAWALKKSQESLGERQAPLLGVTAAFVFAAQMLNFPVAAGTSGHFMGALMAAILLGPWNAFLIMALVLSVQCLFFADGGLTALGTNIFNMGIIGGIVGYGLFKVLKAFSPNSRQMFLFATAFASWLSIVLASGVCALQLAYSGTTPLLAVLPAMLGVHMVIGVGEAIITTVVVSSVLASRPDLIYSWNGFDGRLALQEAQS